MNDVITSAAVRPFSSRTTQLVVRRVFFSEFVLKFTGNRFRSSSTTAIRNAACLTAFLILENRPKSVPGHLPPSIDSENNGAARKHEQSNERVAVCFARNGRRIQRTRVIWSESLLFNRPQSTVKRFHSSKRVRVLIKAEICMGARDNVCTKKKTNG